MKFKTSISFVVAIALAVVTAKVGMDYIKKHGGGGVSASRAVVFMHDMDPGTVVQASDVALKEIPLSMMTPRTLREVKDAVGRTIIKGVATSYPVTEAVLAPLDSGSGVQALIPPGMRLVPIDVSDSGVASLISVGSKVDVMVTLRDGDQPVTKAIVQNVKVQYVQRQNSRSNSGRVNANNPTVDLGPIRSASVLVTPEQAARIELASNEGKPRLVLRSGSDTAEDAPSINRNGLLGKVDEVKPEPAPVEVVAPSEPKKPTWDIQIIKGGTESIASFDENGKAEEGKKNGATPATAAGKQQPKKPAGAARNESESGTAPDQAPRTDAGRGNLP